MCPFPGRRGKAVEGTLKNNEKAERDESGDSTSTGLSLTKANVMTTTTAQKLPTEDSAFAFNVGKPSDLIIRGK